MTKGMSFIFALLGVAFLICTGIALSYRAAWLALLFIILFIVHTGAGFVIKARMRRRK